MKKTFGNVVLITGASSGIGRATAEYLSQHGYKVYGTSRKIESGIVSQEKNTDDTGFIRMLRMDVLSDESVKEAVNRVLEIEGTIDVLINNAGYGIAGSVEDTSHDEAFRQFDTNFFGMLRVIRSVLPVMRENRKGLIINISSVAALIPIPYQSMYCASKAATESVTEILRMETAQFGIKVCLVEPGDTKTGFTNSRVNARAAIEGSPYYERFVKAINVMIHDETHGPEPIVVAKSILRLLSRKNPPVRIAVGFRYKLLTFLRRLVPYRLASFIISRLY